jgi:predicted RNA-binding protein
METKDWLIVESFPNWKVDEKNRFSYFGLTERSSRMKDHIKAGDRLFAYVTGKSSFSDIREVVKDGLRQLPAGGDYETSLPYCIDTKPILVLPPKKWVSIHDLKDKLKLISGQSNWGYILRMALRRLEKSDAVLLTKTMAAKNQE